MLEEIVNAGRKYAKKGAVALAISAGLLSSLNCSRVKKLIHPPSHSSASSSSSDDEFDPNPADDSFMDGVVLPPNSVPYTLASIDEIASDGSAYTSEGFQGQAIVIFDTSKTDDDAAMTEIVSQGGTVIGKVPNVGLYLASVPIGAETAFLSAMRTRPGVLSNGLNKPVTPLAVPTYTPAEMSSWSATEQEYLKQIRAFEGWNLVETDLKYKFNSSNMCLSIIDEDFDNPLGLRIDDISSRALIKMDAPTYTSTHGFEVATFAGATGDNADKPVGIDWHTPLRLISIHQENPAEPSSDVFRLLRLAAQEIGQEGAEVVNISLSFAVGPTLNNETYAPGEEKEFKKNFTIWKDIFDNVSRKYPEKRFLAVIGAGNDDAPMDWPELQNDRMLVVGSCNSLQAKAGYSNYGSLVDVFVPGMNSQGQFPVFLTPFGTIAKNGTSYATPVVSGLASLLFEANPTFTSKQVKDRIIQNATAISGTPLKLVDVYAALQGSGSQSVTPPPTVVPAWANTYGTGAGTWNRLESIDQLLDGSYISAGMNVVGSSTVGLVMHLNPDGTMAWKNTYTDGFSNEFIHSIIKTSDGGYAFAGERTIPGFGLDFWVVKLASDGSIAWQNGIGTGANDVAYDLVETADGGVLAVGLTWAGGIGPGDLGLVKFNSDGSDGWQKVYNSTPTTTDIPYALSKTSDGGFIIAGSTGLMEDGFVLKLFADGSIDWQKKYGNPGLQDILSTIEQTSDGGYVVGGRTSSIGASGTDYQGWVVKLDAAGVPAWQKEYTLPGTFTESGNVSKVRQTSDGGYIVTGSFGAYTGAVLKLNTDGTTAWERSYPTPNGNLRDIRQTNEGGYVICGYREAVAGVPPSEAFVMKANADGTCPPLDAIISVIVRDAVTSATSMIFVPSALFSPTYVTSAIATDTPIIVTPHAP